MSEIPNTKKHETEDNHEQFVSEIYELSQGSPREFAKMWDKKWEADGNQVWDENGDAKPSSWRDQFAKFAEARFEEHGGLDSNATEMSEPNKRLLYCLRESAKGTFTDVAFQALRDNPNQRESFDRFAVEQDARAIEQRDVNDVEYGTLLNSFTDSPEAGADSSRETLDIQSRLNPEPSEPLSEATKKDFFDLSRSADQTFQEKLDRLDNEQQKEVRAYVKQSYENMKVAEMSLEGRKQYFAAQREKQASEQEKVAEMARQDALEVAVAQEPALVEEDPEVAARRENPQSEEDYEELHALKLSNGVEFKDVYTNKLSPEQKVKFDAREAKYDARIMVEDPDFLIPRLSRKGEWTSMSGSKPENDAAGEVAAEKPDSTPLVSRGGNIVTPFNHEYQGDEAELKDLADLALSSNPEDKKEYANAVKGMSVEKLAALSKYRSENPVKPERGIEDTLGEKYMHAMYENAHSDDSRLRQDFAVASRGWSDAERNQYTRYSATIQTELADQERQQPQTNPGPLRRLWNRRPWGKKK